MIATHGPAKPWVLAVRATWGFLVRPASGRDAEREIASHGRLFGHGSGVWMFGQPPSD